MRTCSKCRASEPDAEFYGQSGYCKPCHCAYMSARARAQRAAESPAEREERLAKRRLKRHGRSHRIHNPITEDRAEYARRKAREYYRRHRDERIAYQRARRDADPDAARAYERAVYARRSAKHQASNRARERGMANPSRDTVAYEAVLRRDPCAYCGARDEIQVDHVVPVAGGGANDWMNLTAACRACNRAKSAHGLLAFMGAAC